MPLYGEAKREYQRQWVARRRQDWIDSQGGCCALCGSTEDLEVDHINPSEKSVAVGRLWSRKESARLEELEKCQVLCSDCHFTKTYGHDRGEFRHGTARGYAFYKCRCTDCAEAATRRYKLDYVRRKERLLQAA